MTDEETVRRTEYRQTSFAADVLKLVSGATFAQLLSILSSPILTRLFPPEAFGTLALFIAVTSIISVIACLRYELSIVLPESEDDAINMLGVSLLIAAIISLLCVPVFGWKGAILFDWINVDSIDGYLWLVPLGVFAASTFSALSYWNTRTKHFARLSLARVNQTAVTSFSQIGIGIAGFGTGEVMIAANVAGQSVSTLLLAVLTWLDNKQLLLRSLRWNKMILGAKRYRKFPQFDTWSALLNTTSWQLPALLLSSYFSSAIVGYYALGFRLLQLPMSLIGTAISQVFFQRASEAEIQNTLPPLVESTFEFLVTIGLFPMIILAFVGRDLFTLVFGIAWTEAGLYVQFLSVWAFFWFVSSPLSTLFIIREKQEFLLRFNVFNFMTRFSALLIGGILQEPRIAVLLFSVVGSLVYGWLVFSILLQTAIPPGKIIHILGKSLLLALPASLILILLYYFDVNVELRLLASGLILVCYYLYVVKTHPHLWNAMTKSSRAVWQ